MNGASYATSAEIASESAFSRYALNKEAMLRVMRNHRRAAHGEQQAMRGLTFCPFPWITPIAPFLIFPNRQKMWGQGARPGRATWLSQCPGNGDCAPAGTIGAGYGLRHHRG